MYLKPGCEEEYQRRHAAIWPELVEMIHEAGVKNLYFLGQGHQPALCLSGVRGRR